MTRTDVAPTVPAGLVVRRVRDDGTGLARYTVFHVATGRRLSGPAGDRCATHIDQVVAIVAAGGVDWTSSTIGWAGGGYQWCMALNDKLRGLGLCFDPETGRARRCAGDRPGIIPRSLLSAMSRMAEQEG